MINLKCVKKLDTPVNYFDTILFKSNCVLTPVMKKGAYRFRYAPLGDFRTVIELSQSVGCGRCSH